MVDYHKYYTNITVIKSEKFHDTLIKLGILTISL